MNTRVIVSRLTAFWIAFISITALVSIGASAYLELNAEEEPKQEIETQEFVPFQFTRGISATDVEPVMSDEDLIEEKVADEPVARPTNWIAEVGDNLWMIAEEVYGNGCMYPYLMELNDMESDTVLVGQNLTIEYFDSNEEYSLKLKECYEKITEWNKVVPVVASGSSSPAKNGNVPSNISYVGSFFVTGYDAWCAHCCGGDTSGTTASGKIATVGRTIATSKQFAMGTKLYIEGYGTYVVEDRGVGDGIIDIAADSHAACGPLTRSGVNVYIVN